MNTCMSEHHWGFLRCLAPKNMVWNPGPVPFYVKFGGLLSLVLIPPTMPNHTGQVNWKLHFPQVWMQILYVFFSVMYVWALCMLKYAPPPPWHRQQLTTDDGWLNIEYLWIDKRLKCLLLQASYVCIRSMKMTRVFCLVLNIQNLNCVLYILFHQPPSCGDKSTCALLYNLVMWRL